MLNPAAAARRAIPSLDRLLKLEAVEALVGRHGRPLVTEAAREELARLRAQLASAPPVSTRLRSSPPAPRASPATRNPRSSPSSTSPARCCTPISAAR
jgi:hypothetical protein